MILDPFNPLDPRTANIVVLSTFSTMAARCLDTYVTIGGQHYPINTSKAAWKNFDITDKQIADLGKALDGGNLLPRHDSVMEDQPEIGLFGFQGLDEGHAVSGAFPAARHAVQDGMRAQTSRFHHPGLQPHS